MRRSSLSSRKSRSLSSTRRRIGTMNSRSASSRRRHGISNSHAFAVGRATGVNINGSGMGAHGAALHRSAERKKSRDRLHKSSISRRSSSLRHRTNIRSTNSSYNSFSDISQNFSTIVGVFIIVYLLIFVIIVGAILFLIFKFH